MNNQLDRNPDGLILYIISNFSISISGITLKNLYLPTLIISVLSSLLSNSELLNLLKEGDMLAFDAIYERYCKRIFAFVVRYVKSETDAEEIVQEVFLKIWENKNKIDVYSSFESYIFTISYNSTISLLRKRVTEKKYIDYLKNLQVAENVFELTDEVYYTELNGQIQSLLSELTPRQKEIFLLSREEGLTHDEIAKKLGISSNTVKNHIVTTLNFLRTKIDNGLVINVFFAYLFL